MQKGSFYILEEKIAISYSTFLYAIKNQNISIAYKYVMIHIEHL